MSETSKLENCKGRKEGLGTFKRSRLFLGVWVWGRQRQVASGERLWSHSILGVRGSGIVISDNLSSTSILGPVLDLTFQISVDIRRDGCHVAAFT